jgi:hypothetical protein
MIQQLTSHREIDGFLFINTSTALQSSLFINNAFFFPIINGILFSLH